MANDFKRMWTREEVKSNSVVDLPDIPEVVDANSPDIIRVQGKLYYREAKEGATNLTGTKWIFNETISSTLVATFNITYKMEKYSASDGIYKYQVLDDLRISGSSLSGHVEGAPEYAVNDIGFDGYGHYKRTIEIIDGADVENADLIAFLQENATLLTSVKTHYNYKELGADEELVRATPTDVNIVKDQNEWQLQLEHDSNVLSITSMNEFMENVSQIDSVDVNVDVNQLGFNTIITIFQNGVTQPPNYGRDVRYNFITPYVGTSASIILKSCGGLHEDTLNNNMWYLQYLDLNTNELKQIIFGVNYDPTAGVVKLKLNNTYTIGTISQ